YIVWPRNNYLDFDLQNLVKLKTERNHAKMAGQDGVGYGVVYTGRDPDNERNRMAVMGNPSLSDVRVILIGIRNNSATTKDGIVWLNELKVTDFNESGGWAAKANATLSMSDVATVNLGAPIESAGFGGVEQSVNERSLDDYSQFNVAVQGDLGRFVPEAVKLRAPIYYSVTKEKTSPKYNPLDQDVLLSDALDECETKAQRDSISAYAVEHTSIQNFSISGLKFDRKSALPMPWDPANFTLNFSFTRQSKTDPTTEYENTNDYRGSFGYSYSPAFKPFKPFKNLKGKSKNARFLKDWELNWLPQNISFMTNMTRYYYEQQTRSETDVMFQLPVSVSKNWLWDRQLSLSWNVTKTLSMSFSSNTSARIEETVGAVNRKLFPDRYREWKDTVWQSILSMGTPWSYNQSFTAQYKAPFQKIAFLDFLSGSVSYNATYRWDRGATIDGVSLGNTVANQAALNGEGRLNFETFYNKVPILKEVTKRFANSRQQAAARKPKKFERTYQLKADTSLTIKHNLRVPKVKITAATLEGTPVAVRSRIVDNSTVEILDRGDQNIKFTITEIIKDEKSLARNIAEYALRVITSPRSVSVRYRNTRTMSLPLFVPEIGNIFGQTNSYGPMAPGLDFAFGFAGEDYLQKALDRGWLMTGDGQTSPSLFSHANELNIEANFELFKGFKVQLTFNRTDNRNRSTQFMFEGMPTSLSGSYTRTHCAILTALRSSKAADGYADAAFSQFLDNIPVVRDRIEAMYAGTHYPYDGFMKGSPYAGAAYSPEVGTVSTTSSDVLIPAFVAAYTGSDAKTQNLNPFPDFSAVLPNWRITYDGLINLGNLRNIFKSFTLSHAYQCTYSVGSYGSFLNWVGTGIGDLGFTLDELSGQPIPSSPYNISSVAITERFAPLIGFNVTLKNDLKLTAEYRDQRTLTLNSSAGQIVEASSKGLTIGAGYKITNFNTVLKMKGSQTGVSNDLTLNADFSLQNNQALIRRIEDTYTQATSGTRTLNINFTASYVLSRRLTLSAYFDHQVNTPVVTTSAYPTSNSSYGISMNLSLAR
ncbi:MAG: cell surface protein SprA, partial [Muribaculaceae bacterium]|nr:cell surface protein SprA [Muribaculaceae bacterium]